MNHRKLSFGLCASLLLGSLLPSPLLAKTTSVKELTEEVRQLKKTVEKLSTLIETQNKRIEQLEKSGSTPQTPTQVVKSKPSENLSDEQKSSQKNSETEAVVSSQSENETPAQNYGQIGPWKYPKKNNLAYKLLPDISLIGTFTTAYFSEDPGEVGHDPSRTGFNLQEIEIAFQSVIDPYIRADVYLAFTEDHIEIEEAFLTTLSALPKGLQFRGGKFWMPFGRQNPKHLEQWDFINDMIINRRLLGEEGFNEFGIEVSYLFPTPFFLQLQAVMSNGETETNFDGERKGDFAYSARLSGSGNISQNTTLLAGASAAFGYNNSGPGNATNLFGGDLLLKWKPSTYKGILWQSEYIYRRREVPLGMEDEGGLYSYLLGNWSRRWSAGLRVDYLGLPKNEDRIFRVSPMLSFRPSEFFRLKLQYDYTDQEGLQPNHAAMLQWQFNMGPHGAHQF
ncbi:MAG: hypothetical protein H7A32_00975 [Deltaproteobacteria bacterium]|nr:hypothetical protein [Deltaproteobacteria bacterium]